MLLRCSELHIASYHSSVLPPPPFCLEYVLPWAQMLASVLLNSLSHPTRPGPQPLADETFLHTAGTVRFHMRGKLDVDARTGDYMVVPVRAPHTFSKASDEGAKFSNTFTRAFYINYFKLLATMAEEGRPMGPEANRKAMAHFTTLLVEM